MNKKTTDMLKIGGAVMAVGTAAAMAAGMSTMKNNPKKTMKKLAKKSAKTVDGIMGNMQYMFK
ncbi:MAG: hypothetical protein IKT89_05770 [Clostridia bacterium]|nr:hypothetical protein [Clostridia bacterium]